MSKILRVYVFDGYRDTVIESQVFNWASALEAAGLTTLGLCLLNRKNVNKDNHAKLMRVADKYGVEIEERLFINKPIIRECLNLLNLIKCYNSQKRKYDKIVFQTRMLGLIYIIPLCRFLTGAKFIVDFRGSPLVEFLYQNAHNNMRKKKILENLERMVCYYSDTVFCVSKVMRDYLINRYVKNSSLDNKFIIIPGAADSRYFYFSEGLRTEKRKELSCSDATVFIYTGRLDKQWQIPDKIFDLFSRVKKQIDKSYFIVLTPDVDIAKQYIKKIQVDSDSSYVEYVSMDCINPFLNAADYAIVLRENLPINNQASPTKIAEYLLTGLSVVISKSIGDFTDFIIINKLGFDLDLESEKSYQELLSNVVNDQKKISIVEQRKKRSALSKQFYAKEIFLEIIKDTCAQI